MKHGINNKQASLLIGKHFSEVDDKLFNLLDLAESKDKSELLLASIEQRSAGLRPFPFTKAIDYKENLKYAKYLIIPIIIFATIGITGNLASFFGSYQRMVNYDLAYEPPAPFVFKLFSTDLNVLESEPYTVQVSTDGQIKPERVFIVVGDKEFLLQESKGIYSHTFYPPLSNTTFHFRANDMVSNSYDLNVLKVPSIQSFSMVLDFPDYINKPTEHLKGTGNATFPEGTKVTWQVVGDNTDSILFIEKDTVFAFSKTNEVFGLSKKVYTDVDYHLTTSNKNVEEYEKLGYSLHVIKDKYPTIEVNQILDSINPNIFYFVGDVSDDYKVSSIELVCYSNDTEEQVIKLAAPNSNFKHFYYTYPSGLNLEAGKGYSFFFKVTDNDAIHKGKSTKSRIFNLALLDSNQLKNNKLYNQNKLINDLDRSLERLKEQKETLNDINKEQKEKSELNFNEKNKIKDFLKEQKQQEEMMQKFSKQLKETLDSSDENMAFNKMLKERLERQELQARKNERLLEELNKVADKIKKEELSRKLDELGKQQQNSERSLEQLLELTKRYYVTEKASQLAKDLELLSKEQDVLSNIEAEDFSPNEQEKLNRDFSKLSEELDELEKDNEQLKKPLPLDISKPKQESVKKDQEEALEELNKQKGDEQSSENNKPEESNNKASKKQKSAAQKMMEMSESLQQSSSNGNSESEDAEDAEMLRQILDNLITFSFKQENLYDNLNGADIEISQFSGTVRSQQDLRGLFGHVDDSLFALSLRRAELSEFVNEQITEVYYNIDKSLESITDNKIYQGVSYQQYVLNASNSLADFLANVLDNMQQSMTSGQGSGKSKEGFQLPDIIRSQGQLQDKMGEMGEKGKSGQQGNQGESGEGNQGESGKKGNQGKQNGSGQSGRGQEGIQGESNEGGVSGENGDGGQQGGQNQGSSGNGQGSEQELREIYEIYKQQQQIRQQLEDQLQNMIRSQDRGLAQKLIQQMEDFENDLIENGITQRTNNKINVIRHQMLRLENATLKQGEKEERKSSTNYSKFTNPIITKPDVLEGYENQIEILNRQALPLQQNFQNKVQLYFKNDN
ncbi:hypothetical protein GGR42_001937 [Saonia flava]|uniref:Uncharacterized protein n=1 Tax=Saonia flava TaxID=523696 RepID=A0A846R0M4_9FLAO|nr:DUF4175 family protein [Saonia flava]NJB71475.1 hypothetical protein [Saonia flava]